MNKSIEQIVNEACEQLQDCYKPFRDICTMTNFDFELGGDIVQRAIMKALAVGRGTTCLDNTCGGCTECLLIQARHAATLPSPEMLRLRTIFSIPPDDSDEKVVIAVHSLLASMKGKFTMQSKKELCGSATTKDAAHSESLRCGHTKAVTASATGGNKPEQRTGEDATSCMVSTQRRPTLLLRTVLGLNPDTTDEGVLAAVCELISINTINAKKAASSLANNLCPDHRDKQGGKPCLACEIERLQR